MKIIALSRDEAAFYGFTHRANISFANGDFTAAAVTQTYTLFTIAAGMLVKNAALRLITPVAGGTIATATVQVGKTGTANAYVTSTNVFTGSTIVTKAGDGASFNQAGGEAFDAASALTATLTTTVGNVSAATAGEFNIFFSVVDLLKL